MYLKQYLRKSSIITLAAAMIFSTGILHLNTKSIHAASFTGTLSNIVSATIDTDDPYVVHINFNDEVEGKITFLENGIFRYNVDPTGAFAQYATPSSSAYSTKIQVQPDDSDEYAHPAATVNETNDAYQISAGDVTISFDKVSAKMSVTNRNQETVIQEAAPLSIQRNSTIQTLKEDETEYFYGGGTQNGRFSHKGKSINIVNEGGWTDGKVASPNPFYWSTKGYGVFRNTFKQGVYDFGSVDPDTVTTKHSETEFDAYYFVEDGSVTNKAEALLNDFYEVTGNPVLLPEYAYYPAHLNCYNRDGWQPSTTQSDWKLEDGNWYKELGKLHDYRIPEGTMVESLNNEKPTVQTQNFGGVINDDTYKFSARAVIDGYRDNDSPLGWFLPNDGYGCGYGQNGYYVKRDPMNPAADLDAMYAAVDANVANLKSFVDYAETQGVKVGLWTQSALDPLTSEKDRTYYHGYQNLRDFDKEVNNGGVVALKTDVAWVGNGYAMALNSTKTGYNIVAESGVRPTLVSLDGWAGTQRYTSIWTGDQTGGNWEYIRFHIPTYIGQSLSGNPNVGSDMNGIFGSDPIIQARDYQWKTFTQVMLDMDGWGTEAKKPYYHEDPFTGMNRMYLKMKAELLPYLYTEGMNATNGLPSIRAMFLEYPEDQNTYGDMVKYQYMFGSDFLVAPIYEEVNIDEQGNDVRNNIYLPDKDQIWIDYFSGKQYQGGKILNGFDAPIWKLPLFIKNGAIVPMYEENNNPEPITETNLKGLDKTRRVIEFWPDGESSYELKEDDGISLDFTNNGDDARDTVNYGNQVTTKFTSNVHEDTAVLIANASEGTYQGYDSNRNTTFVVNVQEKPRSIQAINGTNTLNVIEAETLEEYNELATDDTKTVYFYDESPNLNKYAKADEGFKDVEIITTPKIYVKFAKTDVQHDVQKLEIIGFNNTMAQDLDTLNEELAVPTNVRSVDEDKTPTSITIAWDAVEDAASYDVLVDDTMYSSGCDAGGNPYLILKQSDLKYSSVHTYQVRAHNALGYSDWSDVLEVETEPDPFRNIPSNMTLSMDFATGYAASMVTDQDTISTWFSNYTSQAEMNKVKTFTFDFKANYKMDRVELYADPDTTGNYNLLHKPRTVTVKRSMDNKHWETLYDNYEIDWVGQLGTIDLSGNNMRYLSITVNTPTNTYCALTEIMPHKVDGTEAIPTGSNNGQPTIDESSMTQIRAYAGAFDGSPTWGQVKDADINFNGVYDVYDMSYVLFQMDGGTKQTGSAAGNLLSVPDKKTVTAGETFKINMYGLDMMNVNAVGGVYTYDSDLYEVISIDKSDVLINMDDFSIDQDMGDGRGLLSIAYMNRGDKTLLSGTQTLATITMRAKVDGDTWTPNNGILIGPNYSEVVTDIQNMSKEVPTTPLKDDEVVELALDENNATKLEVGQLSSFKASLTPTNVTNKYYTVTSDNPNVVEVIRIERDGDYVYYLRGTGAGSAKITVAAAGNPDIFITTDVTVHDIFQIVKGEIVKAEVLMLDGKEEVMTSTSWTAFLDAYTAALQSLQNPEYVQEALDLAAANLRNAMSALQIKVSEKDYNLFLHSYKEALALSDQYTEEEFAKLNAVLEGAEVVLAKGLDDISELEASRWTLDIIKEQMDLIALENADALLENLVDTIALANGILATEEAANARPEKVAALQNAVNVGQALVDETSHDRIAIKNAVKEINHAAHELWEIINKDKLLDAIKMAEETINDGNFEITSLEALKASIQLAKEIAINDNATNDEVDGAYDDVIAKLKALRPAVDKSALELQIEIANDILNNESIYVPSTILGLRDLLHEAEDVEANQMATQSTIKEMTKKLTDANMKARKLADKSKLMKTVQRVLQLDLNDYTRESSAPLQEILKDAQALIDNEEAYQEVVDAMIDDINAAINALEKVKNDKPIDDPAVNDKKPNGNTNVNKPSGNIGSTSHGATNSTNTSDETNPAGFGILLLLAGAVLIVIRKKASNKHNL